MGKKVGGEAPETARVSPLRLVRARRINKQAGALADAMITHQ